MAIFGRASLGRYGLAHYRPSEYRGLASTPGNGYSSFSGAWEDWCAKTYANDPAGLAKCNTCPLPTLFGGCPAPAPWTALGKTMRGMSDPVGGPPAGGTGGGAPSGGAPVKASWTVGKKVAVAGGVLALAGVGFVMLKRRKGRR